MYLGYVLIVLMLIALFVCFYFLCVRCDFFFFFWMCEEKESGNRVGEKRDREIETETEIETEREN